MTPVHVCCWPSFRPGARPLRRLRPGGRTPSLARHLRPSAVRTDRPGLAFRLAYFPDRLDFPKARLDTELAELAGERNLSLCLPHSNLDPSTEIELEIETQSPTACGRSTHRVKKQAKLTNTALRLRQAPWKKKPSHHA